MNGFAFTEKVEKLPSLGTECLKEVRWLPQRGFPNFELREQVKLVCCYICINMARRILSEDGTAACQWVHVSVRETTRPFGRFTVCVLPGRNEFECLAEVVSSKGVLEFTPGFPLPQQA